MIEIPNALIAARAALEATKQRQAAITSAALELGGSGAAAAARKTELDGEIARRRGVILRDKALATISPAAGATRISAREIAGAERELAALITENDELKQKAEEAEFGRLALADEIAVAGVACISAARVYIRESQNFDAELAAEFARDVGRLVLPELFDKWGAIGDSRVDARLSSLSIANFSGVGWDGRSDIGAPVLHQGIYRDPELGRADWKGLWRTDPMLAALRASLDDLRVLRQRAESMVATDQQGRDRLAEQERLAEQRRRQAAYHPVAVSQVNYAPAMTRQEMEPRSAPPKIIGPVIGDA